MSRQGRKALGRGLQALIQVQQEKNETFEKAMESLHEAQAAIAKAKEAGCDIREPKQILASSEPFLKSRDYAGVISVAQKAKECAQVLMGERVLLGEDVVGVGAEADGSAAEVAVGGKESAVSILDATAEAAPHQAEAPDLAALKLQQQQEEADEQHAEFEFYRKAFETLWTAQRALNQARIQGMNVTEPEALLDRARRELEDGFKRAQSLSSEALEILNGSRQSKLEEAQRIIEKVRFEIHFLDKHDVDTSNIRILLVNAIEAGKEGDYAEMAGCATEALEYARFVRRMEMGLQ